MTNYYQDRYRELEADGLLPAAAALAPVFQAGADATASDHDLDTALAATGADPAARLAAREALSRLGYVRRPPGQLPPVTWSAGIPSLMTHVLDHATPPPSQGCIDRAAFMPRGGGDRGGCVAMGGHTRTIRRVHGLRKG